MASALPARQSPELRKKADDILPGVRLRTNDLQPQGEKGERVHERQRRSRAVHQDGGSWMVPHATKDNGMLTKEMGGQFSAKVKAEVLSLYESGQVGSVRAIYRNYAKTHTGNIPSLPTMKAWCRGRKRGARKELIEARVEENTVKMFARMGMPRDSAVRKTIELIKGDTVAAKAKGLDMYWQLSGLMSRKVEGQRRESVTHKTIFVIPSNGFEPELVG